MTFLHLLRRLFSLLSLAVLALAVYLIWTGYQRADENDPGLDPALAGEGDETRLWIGWGLLALSFFGRFLWPLLLAKGGKGPRIERGAEHREVVGADGSKLRVEFFGRQGAPVLILTHGWGLDSTVWRYARAHLADRFRLIVWDLPGLGKSKTPPDGRIQLDRFAEDLRTVIGLAEGQPVVLVGHSIGGMTLQTLAGLRPELMGEQVKGLVLLNTTFLRPIRTTAMSGLVQAVWPVVAVFMKLQIALSPLFHAMKWQSYMSGQTHMAARIGGFGRHVTRQQLEHTALLMTKASPAVEAKGDFAMMDWDVSRKLPDIRVPTLVIVGDRDLITRPDAGETIAAAIPGARLQHMTGCGHMGFYEYNEAYDRAIADFATEVLKDAPGADRQAGAADDALSTSSVRVH
jgi:pimeloyl-ACP methyl ester carboxylesterase